MKRMMLLLALSLMGAAPADREALRDAQRRLKQVGSERHKELLLIREREKSDLRLARTSAARGEALHALILEIHEKSRRDRLALHAKARLERERLKRVMKNERERLIALRRKK